MISIKNKSLVIILFVFTMTLLSLSVVSATDYTVSGTSFDDINNVVGSVSPNDSILLGNNNYVPGTIKTINVNTDNVTIKGQSSSSKATLNAQGSDLRILIVRGSNVRLENLIFINSDTDSIGSALYSSGANLTIVNCEFSNNRGYSGPILLENSSINVIIQDCIFSENIASPNTDVTGAAAAIDSHSSNGIFINCIFKNNFASKGGGALYFIFGSNNTVINCNFINNTALLGGAIWLSNNGTLLNIIGSNFTNNKATDGNGGAIYSINPITISNSNFDSNYAKNNGGAIYTTSSLSITGSNFNSNSAANGGGIYSTNSLILSSTSGNNNQATTNGGFIYNSGTLIISSSSFSNNQANSRLTVSVPSFVNCSNIAVIKVTFLGGNNIKDAIYSNKNINFNGINTAPNGYISNQNIALTVNGKTFNNKTNNQGIATFNINTKSFAIKKHNGVSKYSNTGSYALSSANFVLNVVTKKITSSTLTNIKTYNTKIQYQARISNYSNTKVKYEIYYYKSISDDKIQYYKNISGTKTVPVFKNYFWKNISKESSTYKWYMQRYYKIYYKQAINNTKTWINGDYKGLSKKPVKYIINSKTKMVKGKIKDFSSYVLPSIDCESNNLAIIKKAKELTKGKKTDTQKANAILKWVQQNINYADYGNTRKGALGTFNSKPKVGNCVDSTHLTVALLRAANIPAKYEAKYVSSIKKGHCWPLVYLKIGKTYRWVEGEATEDKYIAFGKSKFTKKWKKYNVSKENYINLYKYSKKYVYDTSLKQTDKWVAILEYHYINNNWLTYYVLNGNADTTLSSIPKRINTLKREQNS